MLHPSQSLWNRAVSFDIIEFLTQVIVVCLNPFGTGQCLSTFWSFSHLRPFLSLNPFGTGQCLSTYDANPELVRKARLNPFGTGQCLSTAVVF